MYVFAIQTARTHKEYNPLLASQWRFHVLPKRTVEDLHQDSIGQATLENLQTTQLPTKNYMTRLNPRKHTRATGPTQLRSIRKSCHNDMHPLSQLA